MKKLIALVMCVAFVSPAVADVVVDIPDFTCSSGNPWSYGETLADDVTVYGLKLNGNWDPDGTYAWPNDMEVYVNPPSGNAYDWDPITDVTGTDPYWFDETVNPAWCTGENSLGYWSFCFGTSYGTAIMTDVTMTLLTTQPELPDPPDSTPVGVPSLTDAYMGAGEVHWYSLTIDSTLDMVMDLSLTATNFPETGIEDTEIGLYDVCGSRLDYDDDSGEGFLSMMEPTLDAGTYYVAVAGYNSTFGMTDFDVTAGGQTGDYTLQITPEPTSLALLAFGGFAVLRRRR